MIATFGFIGWAGGCALLKTVGQLRMIYGMEHRFQYPSNVEEIVDGSLMEPVNTDTFLDEYEPKNIKSPDSSEASHDGINPFKVNIQPDCTIKTNSPGSTPGAGTYNYSTNEKPPGELRIEGLERDTALPEEPVRSLNYTRLPPLCPLHEPIKLDTRTVYNIHRYKGPTDGK